MGVNSSSSSGSSSFSISALHDHLCFGRSLESFSSSSPSSTLVSWEDTTLSSIPRERVIGESEVEISPSRSVSNDLSASGDSSKGSTSTRFEPYVRATRFFVETMGDDWEGGEEVGGAVLGELFKATIGNASLLVPVRHFGALRAKLRLPSDR